MGGEIDSFKTIGLYKKIDYEKLNNNIKVCEDNFYESRVKEKYDLVYCYRTLHLNRNNSIPIKRKVKKLMSSVKDGGYLYIYYYMAEDQKDFEKYPSEKYFRDYEMKNLFDQNLWDIIFCVENKNRVHLAHPNNNDKHYHKTGVILARKINSRRKYIYHYIYSINIDSIKSI